MPQLIIEADAGLEPRQCPQAAIRLTGVVKQSPVLKDALGIEQRACRRRVLIPLDSDDGRGGFRTCDLSRVKRALSH
jgi:hypothetical protein